MDLQYSVTLRQAKRNIGVYFRKKLSKVQLEIDYYIGMFLHPAMRALNGVPEVKQRDVRSTVNICNIVCTLLKTKNYKRSITIQVHAMLKDIIIFGRNHSTQQQGVSCSSSITRPGIMQTYLRENDSTAAQESISDLTSNEFAIYTSLPYQHGSEILEWWNADRCLLSNLYKLALVIFAIPASSATVESHFSLATDTVTPKRNKLLPERVRSLLQVKRNLFGQNFTDIMGTGEEQNSTEDEIDDDERDDIDIHNE